MKKFKFKKFLLLSALVLLPLVALVNCTSTSPAPPKVSYNNEEQNFIDQYKKLARTYKLGKPYKIEGQWFYPKHDPFYDEVGIASWYGPNVGKLTANGELFDQEDYAAAHPTLPMPSIVEVENLQNGKKVVVKINDRGPFAHDRIIDLTPAAAKRLDMIGKGVAKVRVRLLREQTLSYLYHVH